MPEYAIVDIETTGGHAAGNSITEIAIRIFDGTEIIEKYDSLIKPTHAIPPYITALTGIDYDMVADSPSFEDIAWKIHSMLSGRIFVAHNVNFDFSFIKYHLAMCGYQLQVPKLCTVRLARKLKPGMRSYSLGNLCNSLGIPIDNRHRAGGDVDATSILFQLLLEADQDRVIHQMLKKGSKEQLLPPNLPKEIFEQLPNDIGVYYFHNDKGKVIYVGKAKNIKKRVSQHFTGTNPNPQRQGFMKDIYSISYETCGTELMALILEVVEIKRLYPLYNRALKKYEPKFGLFTYEDLEGYKRLLIGKYNKSMLPIQSFTTQYGATNKLKELIQRFQLCAALCKLGSCELCSLVDKHSSLICRANTPVEDYNQRVDEAIAFLQKDAAGFYIIDQGRHHEEQSCIWVENGNFYGMGYIDSYSDIHDIAEIKERLTPYSGNHYIMQLVVSYMCKHPHKVHAIRQNNAEASALSTIYAE